MMKILWMSIGFLAASVFYGILPVSTIIEFIESVIDAFSN